MATNPYDLDETEKSLETVRHLLEAQINVEALFQILLLKNLTTREEIAQYKEAVMKIEPYKTSLEYLATALEKVEYYKNNQEAYLKDLMVAKMSGKIK